MDLEKWDEEAIIKYHQQSERGYAADISSSEIFRLSKKYIEKRVLDIGAGSGALIDLIPSAVGLDLVSKHSRIIKGDILDMLFEDESFDTIFATEVLEHLDNRTLKKGLDEIYRILQKGGYLIITVPHNEDFRWNIAVCPKCGAKFHREGHIQVFNEKRMRKILEKKGFKIIKIRILPIGFMAIHKFLKYFRYFLKRFGFLSSNNLFVVAVKI